MKAAEEHCRNHRGAFISLLPWVRLFIILQSGQEEGGGQQSFNPFHLGFNPNILVALKSSASLDIVIIIHHHHHPPLLFSCIWCVKNESAIWCLNA